MDFATYLEKSSGWLTDLCCLYDLAESTRKAMNHDYCLPKEDGWDSAPYLASWKGRDALQDALPIFLKTSLEAAKAAELVMGQGYKPNPLRKTPIQFSSTSGPRVEETVARLGIITQFEVWKEFAQCHGYPINIKRAKNFEFSSEAESEILIGLINVRNSMTHDIEIETDPTMKQFVEFSYDCRWLASKIDDVSNR